MKTRDEVRVLLATWISDGSGYNYGREEPISYEDALEDLDRVHMIAQIFGDTP